MRNGGVNANNQNLVKSVQAGAVLPCRPGFKTCSYCKQEFPATTEYFKYSMPRGKNGPRYLSLRCKACFNKHVSNRIPSEIPNTAEDIKLAKMRSMFHEPLDESAKYATTAGVGGLW